MHHKPLMASQHSELIHLVHTADILCRALDIGNGGEPYICELNQQVWTQMNLSSERLDELLGKIMDSMKNVSEFLDLVRQ